MAIIQRARINPKSLTHADVMQLQRTIGNRAVVRLLSEIGLISSKAKQAPPVQRQELVQRQEIPEEEEPLQGKMAETIQRQEITEEEEPLQGKMIGTIKRQEIPEEEETLQTKKENNTGMPDNLKAGVENMSGIDMSDVRVHSNSSKPAEVGALAYTQGTDIHVAPGQEKHLPHEAWHVVQQAQGRVRPTMQLKGLAINDDEGLEQEADSMGGRAVQFVISRSDTIAQKQRQEKKNEHVFIASRQNKEIIQLEIKDIGDPTPDELNLLWRLNSRNLHQVKENQYVHKGFHDTDFRSAISIMRDGIKVDIPAEKRTSSVTPPNSRGFYVDTSYKGGTYASDFAEMAAFGERVEIDYSDPKNSKAVGEALKKQEEKDEEFRKNTAPSRKKFRGIILNIWGPEKVLPTEIQGESLQESEAKYLENAHLLIATIQGDV